MSGINLIASTVEVSLSAAVSKTVLQVTAAANHRIRIKSWAVSFAGISATARPVQVRLVRQTSAGTMLGLSLTPMSPTVETIQSSAQYQATVEPTTGVDVDAIEVHPQSGYEFVYTPGDEVYVAGGERIGIICLAAAAVEVRAKIRFEE